MTFRPQWDELLHKIENLQRQTGQSGGPRYGYVKEVKEGGGERKCRVVMGFRPDGSEWLSPWLHCDDHSGGGREQQLYEKGQNVTVSAQGNDFRMARVSPSAQSKSFPQPDFAPQTNGETKQYGNFGQRMHKPGEQQQGGQGGAGGGGGGGGAGGGGGQSGGHIYDAFMFEAQKHPAHQDQQKIPLLGGGGGGAGPMGGGAGAGGETGKVESPAAQQQQQKEVEPTIISRIHEKDKSITHFIKEGKNRAHTTDKGCEISANDGKTYGTAFTDGPFQVVGKPPQVNMPWRIKTKPGLKKTDVKISKS